MRSFGITNCPFDDRVDIGISYLYLLVLPFIKYNYFALFVKLSNRPCTLKISTSYYIQKTIN